MKVNQKRKESKMKKNQKTEIVKKQVKTIEAKHNLMEVFTPEELEKYSVTGTEDIPPEERRPPLYVWNLDTIDENNTRITREMFYNTQTGETFDEIICTFISIKRTREYTITDEGGTKSVVCRSVDRKVGININGEIKSCENCQYRIGKKQGERKDCTIVSRCLMWDNERNDFFVMNFKRSSYVPFNSFIEKNFLNQIKVGPRRRDIPLFVLKVKITLEPKDGPTIYYVPKFEVLEVNEKLLIEDLKIVAENFAKSSVATIIQEEESVLKDKGLKVKEDENPFESEEEVPF